MVLNHCSKLVKCNQVEELDGQLVTDAKSLKKEEGSLLKVAPSELGAKSAANLPKALTFNIYQD